MSLYQIRIEGWRALTERLEPAGAMRFIMQYDTGHGDYTEERRAMFADLTIDEIFDAINKQDRSKKTPVETKTLASKKSNGRKAASVVGKSRQALSGKRERHKPAK